MCKQRNVEIRQQHIFHQINNYTLVMDPPEGLNKLPATAIETSVFVCVLITIGVAAWRVSQSGGFIHHSCEASQPHHTTSWSCNCHVKATSQLWHHNHITLHHDHVSATSKLQHSCEASQPHHTTLWSCNCHVKATSQLCGVTTTSHHIMIM